MLIEHFPGSRVHDDCSETAFLPSPLILTRVRFYGILKFDWKCIKGHSESPKEEVDSFGGRMGPMSEPGTRMVGMVEMHGADRIL